MSQADSTNPETDATKDKFKKMMEAYPQTQVTYQLKDGMAGQKKYFGNGCDNILTIDKQLDGGDDSGEAAGQKVDVKICFDEATAVLGNVAVMDSEDCVNVYIPTCNPAAS
jgi:ABC-type phosphate transport system substrate-binding protein